MLAAINSPRNQEILIGLIAFDNVWGYDNIYAQIDGYNLHEQIHYTIWTVQYQLIQLDQ